MESIKVTLNFGEVKKTSVLFTETPANDYVAEIIGNIYLPKTTVGNLIIEQNYQPGHPIVVEFGNTGDVKLMPEKPTRNTWKFNEETVSEFVPGKIGSVYVPKSTLEKLGYCGDALYMSIKVAE